MARFCPLFSSSKGNCYVVGTSDSGVMIDAGVSCRQITEALAESGFEPGYVKALFVTHEHNDHTGGVRVFAKKNHIPVYATAGTFAGMAESGITDGSFEYHRIFPEGVEIGDIRVTPFRTSHDVKESCGYKIELPGRTAAIATDTGIITDETRIALKGADLVVIESNHDVEMLNHSSYPPGLRARIRSETGHLSNDECAAFAVELYHGGTRRFVLAHLSEENNLPQIAFNTTRFALAAEGAVENTDYTLTVARVKNTGRYTVF